MNRLKIIIFAFFACSSFNLLSQQSIIILYGCSSSGKTSIATELLKILPEKWVYIPSNQFRVPRGNKLLWDTINETTQKGLNVIVDTHDFKFFIDPSQDLQVVTVLLYCSPEKLIEHVYKRNTENNKKNHRELKTVFREFCRKYKAVKKNQAHIDTLNKERLKNSYGFFITLALKKIMNQFFQNDQKVVHIAPLFNNYDCFIDTGKLSIAQSAQKIISFLKKLNLFPLLWYNIINSFLKSQGIFVQLKNFFLIFSLFFVKNSYAFLSYMNDEEITFKTILAGDCCTSIDYNIINDSDGNIGGKKRLYGIHNMSIEIPGFEIIDLIKNDICIHPHLFTVLNNVLSNNNLFVQRWSCVKWFLPLSFGFKVENNMLHISSSIWKYKILSILRAKETIPLIKKTDYINDDSSNEHLKITVSINGRSVVVEQKTIVQIYSVSSLHPLAVLARCLFL